MKKHQITKLINDLSKRSGHGTELISLYIPKSKNLQHVINSINNECSTASNIKSNYTRHNVEDSLNKIIKFLSGVKTIPQNGLILFCGIFDNNTIFYHLEPMRKLEQYLYRCDEHFHVDILKMLTITDDKKVGFLALDTKDAGWGILFGNSLDILGHTASGIPGKHRQGGQSAKRFEKLREMHLNTYYSRVAELTRKFFLDENNIDFIILSGPGPTKQTFLDQKHLEYRLQKKVKVVLDCSYAGKEGIRESFVKAEDSLSEIRLVKEKSFVEEVFKHIQLNNGLCIYGHDDIISMVDQKNIFKHIIICDNYAKIDDIITKCGYNNIIIEIISGKTEYGTILGSLGGVAGILNYKKYN